MNLKEKSFICCNNFHPVTQTKYVKKAVLELKNKISNLQDSDYPGQLFHGDVQDAIKDIFGDWDK